MQPFDKLHWRGHLLAQNLDDLGRSPGATRIESAVNIGHQGQLGLVDLDPLQHSHERFAGRRHDFGVKGMAHRQRHRAHAHIGKALRGGSHGIRGPTDHRLLGAVDVGDDHVAVDFFQGTLDLAQWGKYSQHGPIIGNGDSRHFLAARTHSAQRIGKRHDASGHQRAVLAQTMAHDHIGMNPVRGHQSSERLIDRKHCRLGDLCLLEGVLCGLSRGFAVDIGKDKIAEALAVQKRHHHVVGLVEDIGDNGFAPTQLGQHIDVLRPLTGVQKRQLRRRTAAKEDTLGPQHFPHAGVVGGQSLLRLLEFFRQLGSIAVVDAHAHVSVQIALIGGRRCGRLASAGVLAYAAQLRGELVRTIRADQECSAQRRLEPVSFRSNSMNCRSGRRRRRFANGPETIATARTAGMGAARSMTVNGHFALAFAGDTTGNVLFEHHMKVGAAKAKGTHARPTDTVHLAAPRPQFAIDGQRRLGKGNFGVGPVTAQAGRKHLVVQGQGGLEHAGSPGRSFEMADI